jgi:hypothetical protein
MANQHKRGLLTVAERMEPKELEQRLGCPLEDYHENKPWKQRQLSQTADLPVPATACLVRQPSPLAAELAAQLANLTVDEWFFLQDPQFGPLAACEPEVAASVTLQDLPDDVLVDDIFDTDPMALRGLVACSSHLRTVIQPSLDRWRLLKTLGVVKTSLSSTSLISAQGQDITDGEIALLTGWFNRSCDRGHNLISSLEVLQLNDNQIGDRSVCDLAGCHGLGHLRTLTVANNRISNTGLCVIAEALRRRTGAFASLGQLNVRGNGGRSDDPKHEAELITACRENACYWPDALRELQAVCSGARNCYLQC